MNYQVSDRILRSGSIFTRFYLTSENRVAPVQDGQIADARIALGGVATKPWKATEAEQVLIGSPANASTFKQDLRNWHRRSLNYSNLVLL
ncbi:MAG: hypothetical protein RM368_36835 [Nostoc sp. DedSLP03]|uniref:hypothetical protein n=1 Tax=Nostoc sp. DedSLP03 TaxID=3075400 RepID=UPI002AD5A53A|nr:hypothetical protein [Nostoc sp. DedSLP03]MDZ7970437.1 hypothetical protein [Nostoc sp. DedSLP03]